MKIGQNFEIKSMKMRLAREDFSGLIEWCGEILAAKANEMKCVKL